MGLYVLRNAYLQPLTCDGFRDDMSDDALYSACESARLVTSVSFFYDHVSVWRAVLIILLITIGYRIETS